LKANKKEMFSVNIDLLKKGGEKPFPLFLLFEINDRFIPITLPGEDVSEVWSHRLAKRKDKELWIPLRFRELYESHLAKLGILSTAVSNDANPQAAAANNEQARVAKTEAGELARDVLEDEELTAKQKAEILSDLSQDTLRAVKQITTRGDSSKEEGIRRCRDIVDQILVVASAKSNIYDEILAIRDSQEQIDHSVMVGTMAVMFALAIGFADDALLADIAAAAVFHDIGLVNLRPELFTKKESQWSAAERKEYETHVTLGMDLLKQSGGVFHPRVLRMISEHHESYDGSGFPLKKKGLEIDETSQILHLANLFDRYCLGKQTGTEMLPSEAFDQILEVSQQAGAVQEIQPELVQRVFQFMAKEKESAQQLELKAKKVMLDAPKG